MYRPLKIPEKTQRSKGKKHRQLSKFYLHSNQIHTNFQKVFFSLIAKNKSFTLLAKFFLGMPKLRVRIFKGIIARVRQDTYFFYLTFHRISYVKKAVVYVV